MENPISKMEWIRKVMAFKLTRVLLMIGFFLFVYQILYAIGVFFAINTMVLSMWLCWLAMFVVFVSVLPVRNALFYVNIPQVIPETSSPETSAPVTNAITAVTDAVTKAESNPVTPKPAPPIERTSKGLHF